MSTDIEITAKVVGIADFREALMSIPNKLRRRALRNALAKGARIVRDAIKANTPVMSGNMKAPYRKPGTVRDAIAVRTSKRDTAAGDVGVFVNVRPAKGSNIGGKNPNDPFYWRFINFDHRSRAGNLVPGKHFLEKGATMLDAALTAFEADLGPQIQRLEDSRGKDPL